MVLVLFCSQSGVLREDRETLEREDGEGSGEIEKGGSVGD